MNHSPLTPRDPAFQPLAIGHRSRDSRPRELANLARVLASAVLLTVVLACAGARGRAIVDVEAALRAARGAERARGVLAAISSYPFDSIAAGRDSLVEMTSRPDAEFGVELDVQRVRSGLLRIEARLVHSASGDPVAHFVTYRQRT